MNTPNVNTDTTTAISGDIARNISRRLIDTYFKTTPYPYTRHHIDSYDQFINKDLISIIQSNNPILILKDLIDETDNTYRYKVEIFIGGENGTEIEIGTPTVSLQNTKDVRILFPNEARLRNLTYASSVYATIIVKIKYTEMVGKNKQVVDLDIAPDTFQKFEIFKIPIMLHSKYCILNKKPKEFLYQAGECPYDNGGYFIIEGAEKVLITRQEQSFNTLYVSTQERDPKLKTYGTIICLSQKTRQTKRVSFAILRKEESIQVQLPFVRKSIPLFVLFRAVGFQSDEEIMQIIFPEFGSGTDTEKYKSLYDKLRPSILEAFPFLNTYSAIQYIKTLTKGFSEAHVIDIVRNQLFTHMSNEPTTQAIFLGDCVRKLLFVNEGIEGPTDKDDTRNQRCLVSGFLVQELFNNIYKKWIKAVSLSVDEEYNYNKNTIYKGANFKNIFQTGNSPKIFHSGLIGEGLMRGFRGKWGTGLGEEKTGVLQTLSRLSYADFMSHCRRVILNFDTTMKMPKPRQLHTSQYGYFCTSETPTGASIGITKNMSIMTAISTSVQTDTLIHWLMTRGSVISPENTTQEQRIVFVPIYINGGIIGYTNTPELLTHVLKLFKRSGCLPYSVSIVFSLRNRAVYLYLDDGRPLRPLVWLNKTGQTRYPIEKIKSSNSWRNLVMGTLPQRLSISELDSTDFYDPLFESQLTPITLQSYISMLMPYTGAVEYIDPYEQNETFIANYPDIIKPETTHVEVHPSTILSLMTSMIPFPHHNQSPRNQLSDSQSKQGISIYATNWKNRFDNSAHILCYGEMPLSRSLYTNYLGEGKMPYGMNCILALACWRGYNQEDGIVINHDALQRGMFRTSGFRSYQAFEEDDNATKTRTRFGNPASIPSWKDLKPGIDYSKLDERGIIREGEIVDENTVIVGAYMSLPTGNITDVSITPQVWTRGQVEKIAIMVNNVGMRLVKIRIVQDRTPELGDKFCLTPDHEVLTEVEGWKPIDKITMADKVCTLSENKYIKYVCPHSVFRFQCADEDIYTVESEDIDLSVTMNHRMFIKRGNELKYAPAFAKDIIGEKVNYKRTGTNNNKPYQFVLPAMIDMSADGSRDIFYTNKTLPERKLDIDMWPEFFGFWYSNGYVTDDKSGLTDDIILHPEYVVVCIEDNIQSIKNINRLQYLIQNLDFIDVRKVEDVHQTTRFIIRDIQLAQYLDYYTPEQLPVWVWKLSQVQCRRMINGIVSNNTFIKIHPGQYYTDSVITSSASTSEQIQRLCFHAGWYGKLSTKIHPVAPYFYKFHINIVKGEIPIVNADTKNDRVIKYSGNVYCVSVPSEIFYVRRNGKAVWTCNSNRHGQKGTIGMLIRGHDMPRTASGIVPDMIMNPHAIPSRMTIGQNLEQLLGKTGALSGFIGDATAFMNDGSPSEYFGDVLEKMGFEKYGNEILYNGATGEQIASAIFIGPVYGMRLKHMVEDKWQARGKGRREQRTHQPTGGRGNQGGLKIGEMDRDAILGHGVSDFFRESFMKRSDGAVMSLCSSCGTMPIHNKRLGISICPLCDGPVKFVGESEKSFEILPPIGKPKSNIIEVEMPYATKLLNQELETYLNIGLRYITSADTIHFESLPLNTTILSPDNDVPQLPLPEFIFPESSVPVLMPDIPETVVSVTELASMGMDVSRLTQSRVSAPIKNTIVVPDDINDTVSGNEYDNIEEIVSDQQPISAVVSSPLPGGPSTIIVDTSEDAMMTDGLEIPYVYDNSIQQGGQNNVDTTLKRIIIRKV